MCRRALCNISADPRRDANTDGQREALLELMLGERPVMEGREALKGKGWNCTLEARRSDSLVCSLVACSGGCRHWEKCMRHEEGLKGERLGAAFLADV